MNHFYDLLSRKLDKTILPVDTTLTLIRWGQKLIDGLATKSDQVMKTSLPGKDGGQDIPLYVFSPKVQTSDEVLVYFHGGGWVFGNSDVYSISTIKLANAIGRKIYIVNYRVAPENPYPQGLEDCVHALKLLYKYSYQILQTSPNKIILFGDSSGGNLAAVTSLIFAMNQLPYKISRQILLYPITYWDHSPESFYMAKNPDLYDLGITSKKVNDFMPLYCPDVECRKDYTVSPLMAKNLSNQPETLIITASLDPLKEEGKAYGMKLLKAGNSVSMREIQGAFHGFFTFPVSAFEDEFYEIVNEFLNRTEQEV